MRFKGRAANTFPGVASLYQIITSLSRRFPKRFRFHVSHGKY